MHPYQPQTPVRQRQDVTEQLRSFFGRSVNPVQRTIDMSSIPHNPAGLASLIACSFYFCTEFYFLMVNVVVITGSRLLASSSDVY